MKAITLWQPWATLLAYGAKTYETRSWETSYRGPIAIHAAARSAKPSAWAFDSVESCNALLTALRDAKAVPNAPLGALAGYVFADDGLPRGCVIATAELVACHEMRPYIDETAGCCIWGGNEYRPIPGNEVFFGDWRPGRYAWEFANMKILNIPIPAKGRQGLWNWEGEI